MSARRGRGQVSRWEWVTGALGLVVVLGAVGFLTREALAPDSPPDLVVRVDSVTRASAAWLVHVRVENRGRATAAAVVLDGELVRAPGDTARAGTTLDYLPGRSTRRGGLYFDTDPRTGALSVRARGYQSP